MDINLMKEEMAYLQQRLSYLEERIRYIQEHCEHLYDGNHYYEICTKCAKVNILYY